MKIFGSTGKALIWAKSSNANCNFATDSKKFLDISEPLVTMKQIQHDRLLRSNVVIDGSKRFIYHAQIRSIGKAFLDLHSMIWMLTIATDTRMKIFNRLQRSPSN